MNEELDWSRVAQALAALGHRLALEPAPARLVGGLTNRNYRVRVDGQDAILRCPPPGTLPPGVCDVGRECRLLRLIAPAFPLAPRSVALVEDEAAIGVPFHVLEMRSGIGIHGSGCGQLTAVLTAERVVEGMAGTLAALHQLRPPDAFGRPGDFVARTTEGWIARAERSAPGHSAVKQIAQALRASVPAEALRPALLHNDLKPDNLLFDPGTGAVTAVLDWEMATVGHRLFDLATTLSYWAEPDDGDAMHRLDQMPSLCPGFGTRAVFAARYSALTGADLAELPFFLLLARLKLGTVFRQLGARDPADRRGFGALGADLLDFAVSRIGVTNV